MKLKEIGKVRYYFKTTIYFYDKQGGYRGWYVKDELIKDNYPEIYPDET